MGVFRKIVYAFLVAAAISIGVTGTHAEVQASVDVKDKGYQLEVAVDSYASGSIDNDTLSGIDWYITNDGELNISGSGEYFCESGSIPWTAYPDIITSARVELKDIRYLTDLFHGLNLLETVDLSKMDTSIVIDMSGTFCGCSSLETINLSAFTTENVLTMSSMFEECKSLRELDLSSFHTENVTDMGRMFLNCSALESLQFQPDTGKVEIGAFMFSGCSSLKTLDVRGYHTSGFVNMNSMFQNCRLLTSLDVSGFDTTKVQDFTNMFECCESLKTLDVSNFNTAQAKNLSGMFYNCRNLESLNLSSFRTEKAEYAASIVGSCLSLKELDLSSFDLSVCERAEFGIETCYGLTKLKAPAKCVCGITLPLDNWYRQDGTSIAIIKPEEMNGTEYNRSAESSTICFVTIDTCGGSDITLMGQGYFFGGTYCKMPCKLNAIPDTFPETPVKEGCRFIGWFTERDGKGIEFTPDTFVTEDMNVYAYWVPFDYEKNSDFIERMYQNVFGRSSDKEGHDYWIDGLRKSQLTGSDLAKNFIFSNELKGKNVDNAEFLTIMYRSFFGREPDSEGYQFWMNQIATGMSRNYVLSQFVKAQEYRRLCNECGIEMGSYESTEPRDRSPMLTAYLVRCYTKALGRAYDEEGLNYWADEIFTERISAKQVAVNFIQYPEFTFLNLSDEEYVKVLYRTFFDREFDQAGYDYWMNQLATKSVSKDEVLMSFANSEEFKEVMKTFGLKTD